MKFTTIKMAKEARGEDAMKTNLMFVMMSVFTVSACIENGPPPEEISDAVLPMSDAAVPSVDASTSPDAYEPPPVDAAIPDDSMPDAVAPPPVDAATPIPDATVPPPADAYEPPPVDAAPVVPDTALPPPTDASAPDACWDSGLDTAPIAPVSCHGLIVHFWTADVSAMHHCTGWSADGSAALIPPATEIVGADGVCAITCNNGESGNTVVPSQCSGVWLAGATADVPRWTTAGCKRLPDHPAEEADQAGCTWDQRCDLY